MKAPKKGSIGPDMKNSNCAGVEVELRSLGVSRKVVDDVVGQFGSSNLERITLAIEATKSEVSKGGVRSPAGLVVFLIKTDLTMQRDLKEIMKSDAAEAAADREKRGPVPENGELRSDDGMTAVRNKFRNRLCRP